MGGKLESLLYGLVALVVVVLFMFVLCLIKKKIMNCVKKMNRR